MTRGEIRSLIASWLDDLNQTYFTPDQVNTWINMAQREVQMELLQAGQNWYEIKVLTNTVQYQADYVFPSDFMTLQRIEVIISGTGITENRQPLTPITINQQDLVPINPGRPSNYYINKDRMTLSPTPDNIYTMRLYYSYRVADLTNDDQTPDVPEQFMEYVAVVAAFNGFIKDDRAPENLVNKREKYLFLLTQMKNDRNQDVPRQVVDVHDYGFSGAWY